MQALIRCPECKSVDVEEDPESPDKDKLMKCRACRHRFSLEKEVS